MPIRGLLIGFRNCQDVPIFMQITDKTDTGGRSFFIEPVGDDHTGMARQVSPEQIITKI